MQTETRMLKFPLRLKVILRRAGRPRGRFRICILMHIYNLVFLMRRKFRSSQLERDEASLESRYGTMQSAAFIFISLVVFIHFKAQVLTAEVTFKRLARVQGLYLLADSKLLTSQH